MGKTLRGRQKDTRTKKRLRAERDKRRKQEIIDLLECEFIEIKEWELNGK